MLPLYKQIFYNFNYGKLWQKYIIVQLFLLDKFLLEIKNKEWGTGSFLNKLYVTIKELWMDSESLSNKTPVPSWCRGRSSPCTRCCRPASSPEPHRRRTWWTPGWAGSPWGRSSPGRTRMTVVRLWSAMITCHLHWVLRGQVQTGVASHVLETYPFSKSNCYFSKRRRQTSEHLS